MNKIRLLVIVLMITSCHNKKNKTKIKIDNPTIDLGVLYMNDTINKSIFINNIGDNKFFIDSVGVSCGCTLISYDKLPILKNQSTEIRIRFIPSGKGEFNKPIVIEGNTDPPFNIVNIKGEVK